MDNAELESAGRAVAAAMDVTRRIQADMTADDTMTKADRSPVTVADFASQALICAILHEDFPDIPIVAEESAAALREPRNKPIRDRVAAYVERAGMGGKAFDPDALFRLIDLGTRNPGERFWTLDPIDGTKGFLRREQYAVALALVVNGRVEVGVLGCPNLIHPEGSPTCGCLVTAARGKGAWMRTSGNGKSVPCRMSPAVDPAGMRFVESYVSSHSHGEMQLSVARELGIQGDPVRMDSQVKYAVVASGRAEIYLRIPHPNTPDYKEKIWDHAAGSLIVTEAGGRVSDIEGRPLDFSAGKTLARNRGILATTRELHPRVVQVIATLEARASRPPTR